MQLIHLGAKMRHMIDVDPMVKKSVVVVDAGSSRGEFVRGFVNSVSGLVSRTNLYCLEPWEQNIRSARYGGKFKSRQVHNVALVGNDTGSRDLTIFEAPQGKYHQWCNLGGNTPSGDDFISKQVSVECVSINNLHTYLGVDYIDYLKMDIEGEEWEVFREMKQVVAERIGQISVELHSEAARKMVMGRIQKWRYNFHACYGNEIFFMNQDRRHG